MKYNDQVSSEGLEKALTVFFRRPALEFSRTLRTGLDKDPEYLRHHASDVYPQLQHFLNDAGAPLNDAMLEEQLNYVAREVVVRLRTIEKGEG